MAQHITVGTKLDIGGAPLDTYVVERIIKTAEGYTLEVRTERQRCFPHNLTGYASWTSTAVCAQVKQGTMRIQAA